MVKLSVQLMRLLFRATRAVVRFAVVEPAIFDRRKPTPLVETSRRMGKALADGLLIAVPVVLIVTVLF